MLLTLFLSLGVGGAFLAARYYELAHEMREFQRQAEMERAREKELRLTILTQQEEVRSLSWQVEDFRTELAGVERLSEEIRSILGLPELSVAPLPVPSPTPVDVSIPDVRSNRLSEVSDPTAVGGRTALALSNRSMATAIESSEELIGIQVALPSRLQELQALRDEVLRRMEAVDPAMRRDPATLEHQLRLLAAAPHPWPVSSRKISSGFGYRRLDGKLEFHKGIDIPVNYGTEVHATKDGIVTFSGWRGTFGWVVEIEHEMGFTTIYAHNSYNLVEKGDRVKAGDVIALSGKSGRATGPHVHYEIHLDGQPVDPMKYLKLFDTQPIHIVE